MSKLYYNPSHYPNLRRMRKMRGWSQEELEKHAGVSQETISRIENGASKYPRYATLVKLARALHTTLARLETQGMPRLDDWT